MREASQVEVRFSGCKCARPAPVTYRPKAGPKRTYCAHCDCDIERRLVAQVAPAYLPTPLAYVERYRSNAGADRTLRR